MALTFEEQRIHPLTIFLVTEEHQHACSHVIASTIGTQCPEAG